MTRTLNPVTIDHFLINDGKRESERPLDGTSTLVTLKMVHTEIGPGSLMNEVKPPKKEGYYPKSITI